jgi:RNA dependent RNA polymerase
MDVFIRNLPDQTTEKGLRKFFKPYLDDLSIKTFSCQKAGKYATLTFLNKGEGQLFLLRHGQKEIGNGRRTAYPGSTPLYLMGSPIYCALSTKPPDKFQLQSLEMEAKTENIRIIPITADTERSSGQRQASREFDSASISCGVWSYVGTDLVFTPQLEWNVAGKVKFGGRRLTLTIKNQHIDFAYSWIKNLTVGGFSAPSMTITCLFAPHFSERAEETDVEALLKNLQLKYGARGKKKPEWKRLPSLSSEHQKIVSSCLVYRVRISSPLFNNRIRSLKVAGELPPIIYLRTHSRPSIEPITAEYKRLQQVFVGSDSALPFPIMFQMQKLAQDAYLPPSTVIELLPEVSLMARRSGTAITVSAIRKLFHQVDYRGPEAEAYQFNLETLLETLRDNEKRSKREELYSEESTGATESENIANIHRAMVTPAGVYLRGPEPETKNRVLRKYNDHLEYFLRVQFCDENGEQVRYDPRVSNDDIFYKRFKDVLEQGIDIAGRKYGFLGFSHSSLRSQTCWFMAPFFENSILHLYQKVIEDLGDFSHIRSPAKCAARIGQAFSDTPNAIPLGTAVVLNTPDIRSNGRVFSDGCGTFSESVLEQIWDALPSKRLVKPMVFQIRFSGKIALDIALIC